MIVTIKIHQTIALASLLFSFIAVAGPADEPLFITQTISIPRKLIVSPPVDLEESNGNILDADDVLARMQSGEDVSLLNPASTDIWPQNSNQNPIIYPAEGKDGYLNIHFDSLVTSPRGLARSRVVTEDQSGEVKSGTPYRMTMSWNMHSALMNAELLKQLGYTIDLPRRYAKARLRFDDIATRDSFLSELSGGTGSLVEQWLIKVPEEKDLTIELRDFALEPARIATPPYYWGAISKLEMQNRRVIRALLVPLVLTSIPDSINLWTWQVGNVVNERVLLFHPFAGNFQGQLNYQDARWIARRVCSISEDGLHKIISAGGYPQSIEPLLYEKLKSRINDLMNLFEVPCSKLPVNASLTFNDPETGGVLVKNGKLLRKEFPGYGFKFIGDDPESPLRKDEMFRYMRLRGLGAVLNAGLEELNTKLLSFDQTDWKQYRDDRWAFKTGPREKLNLSASRKLVSGTYFGSESQVQLLDQVSISASLGYFFGFKNRAIQNIDFSIEPNVAISRSYQHVKPMASIQEAVKTPWKDLPVIPKMRSLARLLDAKTDDDQDTALNDFLAKFVAGENFSIVDSIDTAGKIGMNIPLPPFQVLPNVGKLSMSGGAGHTVLRRTMIQCQTDGRLQITLHRVKKNAVDFALSYNFILDIVNGTVSRTGNDARATVYVLDPNTIVQKKELNASLRALLMSHDTSVMEKNFKPYELEHDLAMNTQKVKILPLIIARNKEIHELEAYAPGSPRDDAHKRELYSIREHSLLGTDILGFSGKLASKAVQRYLLPESDIELSQESGGLDPSSNFLGRSHSNEILLETELTPTRNSKTLMTIQESYKGWVLSHDRMIRIIKRLEKKAHEVTGKVPSLIHYDEFLSTTKLLLYQITSELRVSGPGFEHIIELAKAANNENDFRQKLINENRIDTRSPEGTLWVRKIYKMMRAVPQAIQSFDASKARLHSLFKIGRILSKRASIKQMLKLVGPENSIFQISVTGFRKNDENGDSAYLSMSIGEENPLVADGAFGAFVREQHISAFEVRGTYLGNGL